MRTIGFIVATGLAALTVVEAGNVHRKPEVKTTLVTGMQVSFHPPAQSGQQSP